MKLWRRMISRPILYSALHCFVLTLLFSIGSFSQAENEDPNYPDEIISSNGKAIKGNIVKIDGTTVYVEVTRKMRTIIITYDIDSLKEIRKDFGAIKIEISGREKQKEIAPMVSTPLPIEKPRQFSPSIARDTAAALAVERDSIYVGALDKEDTSKTQSALVDHLPTRLSSVGTEYPSEAIKERLEGEVELRLWIDKQGIPQKYEVVECTDPIFIPNSVACAMKWEFSPATVKGTPVGVWASVTFNYMFQK